MTISSVPDWFENTSPPPVLPYEVDDLRQPTGSWLHRIDQAMRIRSPLDGVVFDGDGSIMPPLELVQGMLPYEGIAFLGGQSGAGKTFIAIDLAVALVTQENFLGHKVRSRTGVVFVAAEGAGTLPARIEAARRHRGAHGRLPIATIRLAGDLKDPAQLAIIVAQISAIDARFRADFDCGVGIVIIDTLAAAFSMQDENANGEASSVMRSLKRLGDETAALVMAVHHYGKSSETGLRGASAFRAGADAVISVLGTRNEVAGTCTDRSVAVAKNRSGSEGPIAAFDLLQIELGEDQYGEMFGSCAVVISSLASAAKAKHRTSSQRLFDDTFETALLEHGRDHKLNGDGPVVRAVEIDRVRDEYLLRKVTGDVDRALQRQSALKAFKRAIQSLPATFATEVSGGTEWIWQP